MFEKWRSRKDFDLSTADVPREASTGDVVVERIAAMMPFLLEQDGEPTVIVRLEGLPDEEVSALAKAVREDRCLLLAALRLYSTYPVLIYSLFIYDAPGTPPLSIEGYRDVVLADVQDFVVRLGRTNGHGRVRLYGGEPFGLLATGRFVLRIPPRIVVDWQQPSKLELRALWQLFVIAAQQRARIPEPDRDFAAAVRTHEEREPNLTLRSPSFGP
ncbi:hypothetical protein [Amycolatopsis saalfeldensis]|uniref:Uncharacterized protein n=1 Tax=Amycolatopsis saalfeldensis TaxID=394193 RepID=A0A1H8Q6R6_9PSEU|nr:hypothetical protein [Amycolatopsis saalfeldensis]SEO49624.1 hypothetical protein SAMN04489732_101220 [Amycolatopsis saalfeldensis]